MLGQNPSSQHGLWDAETFPASMAKPKTLEVRVLPLTSDQDPAAGSDVKT